MPPGPMRAAAARHGRSTLLSSFAVQRSFPAGAAHTLPPLWFSSALFPCRPCVRPSEGAFTSQQHLSVVHVCFCRQKKLKLIQ